MLQSFKAILDERGQLHAMENVKMPRRVHVIVTVLDESDGETESLANSLLSEESLAKEWLSDEEEAAWKHLQ